MMVKIKTEYHDSYNNVTGQCDTCKKTEEFILPYVKVNVKEILNEK